MRNFNLHLAVLFLAAAFTLQGQTVQHLGTNVFGLRMVGNAGGLTNLTGANVTGTVPDATRAVYVTTSPLSNSISGNATTATGATYSTNLTDGGNILAGTVPDARLSSNVALKNGTNSFAGTNSFTKPLRLGTVTLWDEGAGGVLTSDSPLDVNSTINADSSITARGATLYGSAGETNSLTVGAGYTALTNNSAANQGATFGATSATLSYGGANTLFVGTNVGIGTVSPASSLHLTNASKQAVVLQVDTTAGAASFIVSSNGVTTANLAGSSNAVDVIAGSGVTITTNTPGRAFTVASMGGGDVYLTNLPFLDAREYGASGTGTDDDSVALQTGLDAANGTTAKTLYIPPGTYYLTNALRVPYGVNVLGAGCERQDTVTPGATILKQNATTNILQYPVISSQWIQDIALRGNSNAAWGGIVISNGIADTSAPGEQFYARNVSVKNSGYAVITASPSMTTFENCYLFGCQSGIGLHLGYVDSVMYRNCNLGYGTNGASINGSTPIFTTTESGELKNLIADNCEIGNSSPILNSSGGGCATFRNCNFERIGYQSAVPTNAFVLRGTGSLIVDGGRIMDTTNSLPLIAGAGAGTRKIYLNATAFTLAAHTAPVEGAVGGPLLFTDDQDTAQLSSDNIKGVWRILVGGQYVYRSAANVVISKRTAAAPTPSIQNRGALYSILSDDSDHATEIDRLAYVAYRTNAAVVLSMLATLEDLAGVASGTTYTNNTGLPGVVVGSGIGTNLGTLATLAGDNILTGSNTFSGAIFASAVEATTFTADEYYGSFANATNGNATTFFGSGTVNPARLATNAAVDSYILTASSAGTAKWQAATGGGDMLGANNLSDVTSAGASRTNLAAHDASNLTVGTVAEARIDSALARDTEATNAALSIVQSGDNWISVTGSTNTFIHNDGESYLAGAVTMGAGLNVTSGTITGNGSGLTALTGLANSYDTIWISASGLVPCTTNPPAWSTNAPAGSDNETTDVLAFDDAQTESANISLVMPETWNLGTVKAKFYWTSAGTDDSVVWSLAAGSIANDDSLGARLGTAVTLTNAASAATPDQMISAATTAITVASPGLGERVLWKIRRLGADAGDTLTGDAFLQGVLIQFRHGTTNSTAW